MDSLRNTISASAITALLIGGSAVGVAAQPDKSDATTRPAIPSAGCGTTAVTSGLSSGAMEVDGLQRTWELQVSTANDGATPMPLVIWLHGQTREPADMAPVTGFDGLGEDVGLVVVAPQGRGIRAGWMWEPGTAKVDLTLTNPDVAFIDALIDRLGEELCLDLARVYATGHSIGGLGSSVLACALDERIAAIAPASWLADFEEECIQERPVPVIAFHGTNDRDVLFEGGFGFLGGYLPDGVRYGDEPFYHRDDWALSHPERAANVAVRNGCERESMSETIADRIERLWWTCPAGAEVELIVAHGDGHTWPGSESLVEWEWALGSTTMEIDASEMIWEFFEQHPMPE